MSHSGYSLPGRKDIRRILIMRWSAMGDAVIASAICEDIHRAFPGCELHLNTLPNLVHLFAHDPRFARIISPDVRSKTRRLQHSLQWLREVRANHYDMVIDLQATDRSRLLLSLLLLSGHRIRYRLGTRRGFPYNIAPQQTVWPAHALDYFRAALHAGGIPTPTQRPVLHVPAENRAHAHRLQADNGLVAGEYGVFMPGSQAAGHLKRWGAQHYSDLAILLHAQGLKHIVLIGASDEMDECVRIRQACGDWVVNLCGQTAIFDIVPICEGARFIVTNDTGTGHVASVTDKPIVVICGPTDPRIVRPCGPNVTALQAELPCINCYQKECSHHSCMAMITPPMVAEKLPAAV